MRTHVLVAGSVAVAFAATVFAHETWMMPSQFVAKAGDDVRVDLTSGMAFPRLESPIKADRVAKAAFRLNDSVVALNGGKTADKSLVVRQAFPTEGVATAWIDLNPKEIELTDDSVAEYLDEIDATDDIRSLWAGMRGRIAWKETYTKHAKTFVAVGSAGSDASWAVGVGQALEFVPVSNPLTVTVGGELTVALRLDSRPLAQLPVGLRVEGLKAPLFRTTDAEGRATFPMGKAGRAMLFAVRLVPVQDGQSWTSDFCTLTFEIHRRSAP